MITAFNHLGSLLLTLLLGVVIVQNWSQPVDLIGQFPPLFLGPLLLLTSLMGAIIGMLQMRHGMQFARKQLKQFEHQKEKAQVQAETQSDQVRVMQNQIATLEKALEKALSTKRDA